MGRSGNGRGSGRCRLGYTSICRRGVSSRGDRCRGGVSDSGLLRQGVSSGLCCRKGERRRVRQSFPLDFAARAGFDSEFR